MLVLLSWRLRICWLLVDAAEIGVEAGLTGNDRPGRLALHTPAAIKAVKVALVVANLGFGSSLLGAESLYAQVNVVAVLLISRVLRLLKGFPVIWIKSITSERVRKITNLGARYLLILEVATFRLSSLWF